MDLFTEYNGEIFVIDTKNGTDISLAVKNNTPINAYHLGNPVIKPFRAGGFVGSVNEGGSVNCFDVSFNPHGNGTHTECVGHINPEHDSVNKLIQAYFQFARLITVIPEERDGDLVITPEELHKHHFSDGSALVVRTNPNRKEDKLRNYSGTNPVYFLPETVNVIRSQGIEHLLVDFPSLDREEDGGKLLAHRAFWDVSRKPRIHASITELIYVPDSLKDGLYWLNLQIAPFESDASPSRPVLYPISRKN